MYKGEPQPLPSVCPLALSTEPKSQVQRFQFLPDLLGKVRPFRAGGQGGRPAWSRQSFTVGQCFRPAWRVTGCSRQKDGWTDMGTQGAFSLSLPPPCPLSCCPEQPCVPVSRASQGGGHAPRSLLERTDLLWGHLASRRGHTHAHTVFLHKHTLPADTRDLYSCTFPEQALGWCHFLWGTIRTVTGSTACWFQGPLLSSSHLICRTVRSRPDSYHGTISAQNPCLRSVSSLFSKSLQGLLSPTCWASEDTHMQTLFRLLRKSESKIGDYKAGCRMPKEAPWGAVGAGSQGVGGGSGCFHRISQEPCKTQGGPPREGYGPQWYLPDIPTYQSLGTCGTRGPFSKDSHRSVGVSAECQPLKRRAPSVL